MSNRSKAYYRHQRQRVIRKKLRICKAIYGVSNDKIFSQPGRLNKKYIGCSCYLCKREKHCNISHPKFVKRMTAMEEELIEYFLEDSISLLND